MNTREKLDLILKELYQYGCEGEYYSLGRAVRNARIPLSRPAGFRTLAGKLAVDKLVSLKDLKFDVTARITPQGLLFCQRTSYAYSGYPIITDLSIS